VSDARGSTARLFLSEGLREELDVPHPSPDEASLSWSCTALQSFFRAAPAPALVGCLPHALHPDRVGSRVFPQRGPRNDLSKIAGLLSWARALLQSPPSFHGHRALGPSRARAATTAPPMRFAPLQRLPARGSSLMARFASPGHLRPRVFSTPRRLHLPRACRPCFMPDPLMGLHPSELFSSRAGGRRLRRRSPLVVG